MPPLPSPPRAAAQPFPLTHQSLLRPPHYPALSYMCPSFPNSALLFTLLFSFVIVFYSIFQSTPPSSRSVTPFHPYFLPPHLSTFLHSCFSPASFSKPPTVLSNAAASSPCTPPPFKEHMCQEADFFYGGSSLLKADSKTICHPLKVSRLKTAY